MFFFIVFIFISNLPDGTNTTKKQMYWQDGRQHTSIDDRALSFRLRVVDSNSGLSGYVLCENALHFCLKQMRGNLINMTLGNMFT